MAARGGDASQASLAEMFCRDITCIAEPRFAVIRGTRGNRTERFSRVRSQPQTRHPRRAPWRATRPPTGRNARADALSARRRAGAGPGSSMPRSCTHACRVGGRRPSRHPGGCRRSDRERRNAWLTSGDERRRGVFGEPLVRPSQRRRPWPGPGRSTRLASRMPRPGFSPRSRAGDDCRPVKPSRGRRVRSGDAHHHGVRTRSRQGPSGGVAVSGPATSVNVAPWTTTDAAVATRTIAADVCAD